MLATSAARVISGRDASVSTRRHFEHWDLLIDAPQPRGLSSTGNEASCSPTPSDA